MILAIDPGSHCAGYAFMDKSGIYKSGVIRAKGDLLLLARKAKDVFDKKFDRIFIESQFIGPKSNPNSVRKCGESVGVLVGVAVSSCQTEIQELVHVSPRRWTNLVLKGMPGDDPKEQMKNFVQAVYKIKARADEADAICMGYCGVNFDKSMFMEKKK